MLRVWLGVYFKYVVAATRGRVAVLFVQVDWEPLAEDTVTNPDDEMLKKWVGDPTGKHGAYINMVGPRVVAERSLPRGPAGASMVVELLTSLGE